MSLRAGAVSIVSGLALLSLARGGTVAAETSLVELLSRAGEYVVGYEDAFRLVVAEELYVQRLRASPGGPVQETRRLGSDVVFVRQPGAALPWWLLRDVYEVDGRTVRDRQARLEKVLIGNPASGVERARAIADEGARFNLGRSVRNFNVPTLVLAFLHPSVQPRFSFEWKGTTSIEGRSFVELAFRELAAPTVVRGPDSHPGVLAAGRVWVHDGKDGALGRTELVIDLTGDGVRTRATLTTEYRPHQALGLWVPVEMRDRLQTELVGVRGRSGSVELVEGLAAYTGFRKAGVSTQEEYRVPEPEPPGPGRPTASFPEPRPQGPRASMNMTHSAAAPIELPPLVSRLLQGRSNRHSTTGVRLPHGNRHPRARALAPRGRGRGDRRVARHSTRGARRP